MSFDVFEFQAHLFSKYKSFVSVEAPAQKKSLMTHHYQDICRNQGRLYDAGEFHFLPGDLIEKFRKLGLRKRLYSDY